MSKKHYSQQWIAVYTKPRHEKSVAKNLSEQGIKVYLPMLRKRQKWNDRKKWVNFPLFKSYVFVCTDIKGHLQILQTKGIIKIIKFGKKVAIIDHKSIKSIKLMIDGGFHPKSTDYFIKGDPVRIKYGPLKGIVGEVSRIDNNNRLLLRIDAIQHSISIEIEKEYLESFDNNIYSE